MVIRMFRKTYIEVNLTNIEKNVTKLINLNNYEYNFGVVKANCYNHGLKAIEYIIKGGCNYLAVSSLDEALKIRKLYKKIPILCLGLINVENAKICYKNNITITIDSLDFLEKLNIKKYPKIHIKIDTGMNRLGIKDDKVLKKINNYAKNKNIEIEGIYTHIYEAKNEEKTKAQIDLFEKKYHLIENVKIVHLAQSETFIKYEKPPFVNGCRLGLGMYGFYKSNEFYSTFKLKSKIIEIKKIYKGETVGYNARYKAKEDEYIGILPVGYADGIIRANTGRHVYIKNKPYEIIGSICMDMLMVKIDKSIKLNEDVEIIKDINHIKQIASYLNTIPYEVLTSITYRVPTIYKKS